jgi:[protein-PII] uridylyltransferase
MNATGTVSSGASELARKKARAAEIRARALAMFAAGTPGIQVASALCEAADGLLVEFIEEALQPLPAAARQFVETTSAVVAVGGTGRGELSPYSDVDLLFLDEGKGRREFRDAASRVVQSCWDAKLELGHSVRRLRDCIALARQDREVATALIEARLIWGSAELFQRLVRRFRRRVVDARKRQFVADCVAAREADFPEPGRPAQELEPNVKCSNGGLRDLHLLRWLGFALYDARDIDAMRLKGALSMNEAYAVRSAWEFLTRVRIDLHVAAGKAQDLLTRDEQLRIADERGTRGTEGQRPVERFMQEYFSHSSALAHVTRRFVARHRPRRIWSRASSAILSHRADGVLRVTSDELDAAPRHLPRLCRSVESVLRLYKTAGLYGVLPSPRVADAVEAAAKEFAEDMSAEAAGLFMDILRCTRRLGPVLRSMYETGLLEVVVPDVRHARCLMQFNQYHHYTVDEHTLRAVETATGFADSVGSIGAAYRAIRHKEILHLALLLHDLGKGFVEHHWEVGRRIALRMADRLRLPPHHKEQLAYLVHKHLEMSHSALRRDITDPVLLLQFSHDVGTPDTLQMLYVLTCADIAAVGPGAFTDWKEELITELFDRCTLILSGKHGAYHEEERLRSIKQRVAGLLPPSDGATDRAARQAAVDRQLSAFSAYYLTCTPPERIADDLSVLQSLAADEVHVQGTYDAGTGTVEYRVLTRNESAADGCFHKMAGVLTAKRLEILSADISTTQDGAVVDSFRVHDRDYSGVSPQERIAAVSTALRDVLRNRVTVESLFVRHRRFGAQDQPPPVSNLPMRVVLDNDSSDSRTVVDVFAHDRPGLLYTVARALYELRLSVDLARISTHYDQVVDVFYVRETNGRKAAGDARLAEIQETLTARLEAFERSEFRTFVA